MWSASERRAKSPSSRAARTAFSKSSAVRTFSKIRWHAAPKAMSLAGDSPSPFSAAPLRFSAKVRAAFDCSNVTCGALGCRDTGRTGRLFSPKGLADCSFVFSSHLTGSPLRKQRMGSGVFCSSSVSVVLSSSSVASSSQHSKMFSSSTCSSPVSGSTSAISVAMSPPFFLGVPQMQRCATARVKAT